MTFALLWGIVIMALTGWQMQSSVGDMGKLDTTFTQGNWRPHICNQSPYMYLRPFYFTTTTDQGVTNSKPAYCGWPDTNSEFRVSVAVLSFVFTFCLYFETHLSMIARTIYLVFTTLYFSCFVLDANSCITGTSSCAGGFKNTDLFTSLQGANVTCYMSDYAGMVVIDFIQVFTFYFLYECWSMTDDLYSDKGQSRHGTKPFTTKDDVAKSPLHP